MPEANDQPWHELLFKNLQLSIIQLLGGTVGAGVSIPITQDYWGWFKDAGESGSDALGLGVYTVLISVVGTWLFLGLFGRAARERGGRVLQFMVQVGGIAAVAWMTLPSALFVTFIAMAVVGQDIEDRKEAEEKKK